MSKYSSPEEIVKKIKEIYKLDNVKSLYSTLIRDEFLKII